MKYKYYFEVVVCNRLYSNFMRSCDLGVDDIGVRKILSFITDKEPTKENTKKIETLLESSKNEKQLEYYYNCVKFISAEVVMEGEE